MGKAAANALADEYFGNGAKKFNKFCNTILKKKKLTGLYNFDDELIDVAMVTFVECLRTFDPMNEKGCKFDSYLYGNTYRAFYDWSRDNTRQIRCNLERDENGKVKRDSKGNLIIINNISLDSSSDDELEKLERIDSGFDVHRNAFKNSYDDSKIENYLERLSIKQRKIVSLLLNGYCKKEIMSILHIDSNDYNENLSAIQAYENVKFLM